MLRNKRFSPYIGNKISLPSWTTLDDTSFKTNLLSLHCSDFYLLQEQIPLYLRNPTIDPTIKIKINIANKIPLKDLQTGYVFEADQIIPGLYLGSHSDTFSQECLEKTKITHILNVSEECNSFNSNLLIPIEIPKNQKLHTIIVDNYDWKVYTIDNISTATKKNKYFTFKLPLKDHSDQSIFEHFEPICNMIHNVLFDTNEKILTSNIHNKILVHCKMGFSRSASIIIAYLMIKQKMSYKNAYNWVKMCRSEISPNFGFTLALQELDIKLNHSDAIIV
jgi:protein-tyrosine phosphatase